MPLNDESESSLYRTRWLMAHNRLHVIVHQTEMAKPENLTRQWDEYLAELAASDEIASKPA
jgi:Zn-dependent peptidase ImmA (M78 family)